MKNDHSPTTPVSGRRGRGPILRFSPTAWAKLVYFRDRHDAEVTGLGVPSEDDSLSIIAVELLRQRSSGVSAVFDDRAVAEFFARQFLEIREGMSPERISRVWVHTHPYDSALPSMADEEAFQRVLGTADWAVLFVLAREGPSYASLRFHVGPGGAVRIPSCVDYSRPFAASDRAAWEQEYQASVELCPPILGDSPAPWFPSGDEEEAIDW